jgi:hypothetical protein
MPARSSALSGLITSQLGNPGLAPRATTLSPRCGSKIALEWVDMALHPDEEATLRAFVASNRRGRMLQLFGTPKRRKQALDRLNHFSDWDPRYARAIDSAVSLDEIARLLRDAGAEEQCRLISDNPGLDGQEMPLEEVLAAAGAVPFASLLCCKPGVLAFFFDEAWPPRIRTLLRRPGRVG